MSAPEVYDFGTFVLDVAERQLSRDGRVVSLAPKAFDLLVVLVRHAGHLVSKDALLQQVWADAHVEEGILAVHMSSVRKALGDAARAGGHIETVSRAGYRFSATVTRQQTGDRYSMRWPIGVLPSQPAVHELVGRGRAYLLTVSRPEIPKAVDAFRAAIEIDATYAAAHAGLALACCAKAELRLASPAEAYEEARAAALRALAMDSACADAQVALGAVLFLSDWNWTGAQRSLERAIALDPGHAEAHLVYGHLLEATGDLQSGLAAKQKALERNPFSSRVHLQIALSYWHQRRYHDVIAWAEKTLAIDPRHLLAREYIAGAYLKMGDFDRHMAENLAHAESFGAPAAVIDALRQLYADSGRAGVLAHTLRHATESGPPIQLAVLHGELGHMDEAFHHLDRAIEQRDPCLVDLAIGPQWDCLRQDARMRERLVRMKLDSVQDLTRSSSPSR